ncbi:MAG: GNAT family N-acetyltransferase [Solobacterium sp.]|nr:GNAT family N-acetyltransferase [Solobacterium sp.]
MEKIYKGILLTTDFTEEDIETSIRKQREIFGGEFGFLDSSHAYPAMVIREFAKTWRPEKDFMLAAKKDNELVGTITLMGEDDRVARLRFLIVDPAYRGIGLGKEIVLTALEWAKEMGYTHVYLTTHSILETARAMYTSMGFRKTGEGPADEVKPGILEETYEIDL